MRSPPFLCSFGSRVVAVVQFEFREPRVVHDRRPRVPLHARAARRAGARPDLAARVGAAGANGRGHPAGAGTRGARRARDDRVGAARERSRDIARWRRAPPACTISPPPSPKRSRRRPSARAVVEQGRIAVGATAGEVILLGRRRHVRDVVRRRARSRRPSAALSRRNRASARRRSSKRASRSFVGSFNELQEQFWRSASVAADGGYVSSATLPLHGRGHRDWRARLPFHRAGEFRRRVPGAPGVGGAALRPGARPGQAVRVVAAGAGGSGERQPAQGRVRLNRVTRAAHAAQCHGRLDVDAAERRARRHDIGPRAAIDSRQRDAAGQADRGAARFLDG